VVCDGAADGLPDPPGGIRAELETEPVVELSDGPHQAEVALLDQIEERHSSPEVLLGDAHDESEVGLDQLPLGRVGAPLNLREVLDDFVVRPLA